MGSEMPKGWKKVKHDPENMYYDGDEETFDTLVIESDS